MPFVFKASVTQSIPNNGIVTLTFLDESTGITGLISRTLNIYDYNGELVDTINMGTSVTANYNIQADAYYTFIESIVDGTGALPPGTVNFLSTAFYISLFTVAVAGLVTFCGDLFGQIYNISNAQNNRYAAVDIASFGQGVVAQQLITYANFLIATPYYIQQ